MTYGLRDGSWPKGFRVKRDGTEWPSLLPLPLILPLPPHPPPLQPAPEPEELAMADDGLSLTVQGVKYSVGDYVYLDPYTFTK